MVDLVANGDGIEYLDRDVRNVSSRFAGRGPPDQLTDPDGVMARLISKAF